MLNVLCWKWNEGIHPKKKILYSYHHVNILYRMLKRHLHIPFKLKCITDDFTGIHKDIQCIKLWDDFKEYGWCFRRLKVFSKEMIPIVGKRILSIDLDCVILNDITPLVDNKNDFMIWRSDTKNAPYCGSLWVMNVGTFDHIWKDFKESDLIEKSGDKSLKYINKYAYKAGFTVGSDQSWINYKLFPNAKYWTQEDGIYNFRTTFKIGKSPSLSSTRIVFFNGSSDPSKTVLQNQFPWITVNWK